MALEVQIEKNEEKDVYDFGFDRSLNKIGAEIKKKSPTVYGTIDGAVAAQSVNFGALVAGALNSVFIVDPAKGLWLGNENFASAPFRVNMNGDVNATSLTLSGYAITANVAQFSGDGSDGTVTIAAGSTTLTRDMYYQSLTIASGARLITAGYKVFVKGTLTLADATSFISNNGGDGGNGGAGSGGTGGSGGSAGTAAGGGTTTSSPKAGKSGGAGAASQVGDGINAGAATAGDAASGSFLSVNGLAGANGGNGGVGAGGGGAGGAGGAAGATTQATRLIHTLGEAQLFINFSTVGTPALYNASAGSGSSGGGGSGGGNGSNAKGGAGGGGAGSGAPGGVVFVFATTISGTGFIEANGGIGGNGGNAGPVEGGSGARGGGGGGGAGSGGTGGLVFCAYISKSANVTLRANGGSAGTVGAKTNGDGGGANGVDGSTGNAGNSGTTVEFNLSS